MKSVSLIIALLIFTSTKTCAQIFFKTEYFGKSSYRDEDNNKVSGSKGSARVYQGGISIPLSVKMNENNRPTMWGISASGAYASLSNEGLTDDLVLNEIMNLQLALFHIRPLNEKWSMMASIGAGVYALDTRFSSIRYRNMLGSMGAVFIRHLKPNLDIGGGLALNTTFGYPMVFPAFYFNWTTEGRFKVKVALMNGMEIAAGYTVNSYLGLDIVAEMNGQMALLEKEGKDKIFTHQYITVGLRPELKLGKHVSIPVTLGIHATRTAYFDDRSLKAMFDSSREYEPYFQISPYISAGLKIGF